MEKSSRQVLKSTDDYRWDPDELTPDMQKNLVEYAKQMILDSSGEIENAISQYKREESTKEAKNTPR